MSSLTADSIPEMADRLLIARVPDQTPIYFDPAPVYGTRQAGLFGRRATANQFPAKVFHEANL
jgi:hypothetical protein